jgi:dihydroflavonol-4-reductase
MNLITGATGHIGNVLVRKLFERGEKVRALILPGEDRRSLAGLNVEIVEGDVLNAESLQRAFEGAQRVYHLAGVISIMPGVNALVRKVNIDGTINVLRAALQAGVRRLIYTSSIHAIQRVATGIIDERLPYDPGNHYGEYDRSKAQASLEVQRAAQNGLDAVIVCPTGVIGPHDFRVSEMGSVILGAALRRPTLYVDGAYDFVDVRDVADGLILACEHGVRGESYILSGERMSVRYLLETIREVTERKFFTFKVPRPLAELGAQIAPLYYRLAKLRPRFTPYSMEVLASNSHISHAKATRDLGYRPRSLKESLADTAQWFLENHHLLMKPASR